MKEDSYEYWYNEAMEAANDAGFAFMSAADVIRWQNAEIQRLKEYEFMCEAQEKAD